MALNKKSNLENIFKLLKKKAQPYAKKLSVQQDSSKKFILCGNKEFELTSLKTGRTIKKKNAQFVEIKIQTNSVGFHFMPAYGEGFMNEFSESLQSKLKGKTCFHFSKSEDISSEIDTLLKKGYQSFKSQKLV